MDDLKKNIPYLIKDTEFWGNVESLTDPKATSEDIAIGLATSGFFCGMWPNISRYELNININNKYVLCWILCISYIIQVYYVMVLYHNFDIRTYYFIIEVY